MNLKEIDITLIYRAIGRVALESELRAIQIDTLRRQNDSLKEALTVAAVGGKVITVPDENLEHKDEADRDPA